MRGLIAYFKILRAAPDLYKALGRLLYETRYVDHPMESEAAVRALRKAGMDI